MIRFSSLFFVVATLAAGCEKTAVLPACQGQTGSCIGVRVEGNLKGVSYFEVTLDRPTALTKRTPEGGNGNIDLPVRFAVIPPAGLMGDVNVGLVAYRGTSAIASAQKKITVGNMPVEVVFTLNEASSQPDLTGQAPTDFTGVPLDLVPVVPTDFTGVPLDLVSPPPADMAVQPSDMTRDLTTVIPPDFSKPADLQPGPPIVVVEQNGSGYELSFTEWTFYGTDTVAGPAPTVNAAWLGAPPTANATLTSPSSTLSALDFSPDERQAGTYRVRITVTSQNTGLQSTLDYDVVIKNTLDWVYPFADPPNTYPNLGSAAVLAAEDWTGDGTDELVAVGFQRSRTAAADPWTIDFRLSMIPGDKVSLPLDPPIDRTAPGYSYVFDSQDFPVPAADTRIVTETGWNTASGEIPFQNWGGFFTSGRGPSGGRIFFRDPMFYNDTQGGPFYTGVFGWQTGQKPFRVLNDFLNQPWGKDQELTTTGRMRGMDNDTDLAGASLVRGGGGGFSANLAGALPTNIDADGAFPYPVSELRPPKVVNVMDAPNGVLAVRAQSDVLGAQAACIYFVDHGASIDWSYNAYCLPTPNSGLNDSLDFCDVTGDGFDDLIWELRDNVSTVGTSTFYIWPNLRPAYSGGPTGFLFDVESTSINGSGIYRLDLVKAHTFQLSTTTYYNSLSCVRRHGLAPQAIVRFADLASSDAGPDRRTYYRLTVDTQPHLVELPSYFNATMVGNVLQGGDFNGDGILDYFGAACPSPTTPYCGYWYGDRGVVIYGRPAP